MALLRPQNGECVESCCKQASRISYTAATAHYQWLGWGRSCICVFPAKSRHTCTGITCLHRPRSSLGGENFQPRWSRVCNAPSHAARSGFRRGNCTCSRKTKRLQACRDALSSTRFLRASARPLSRRIPPMPRWGQQFLLLEIYSMQRTNLLGEEMSKYRERTLRRFATAIEDGYGGEWTRRGRDGVWTEWDETRDLRWSSRVRQSLSTERRHDD
jgi:hypothetical protein